MLDQHTSFEAVRTALSPSYSKWASLTIVDSFKDTSPYDITGPGHTIIVPSANFPVSAVNQMDEKAVSAVMHKLQGSTRVKGQEKETAMKKTSHCSGKWENMISKDTSYHWYGTSAIAGRTTGVLDEAGPKSFWNRTRTTPEKR